MTYWPIPWVACQKPSFWASTLMPTCTAGILSSPTCLANVIPTEAEKIVKMICALERWMAESSAVTSVSLSDGRQTPTTSMPMLGMVVSAALIMGSTHTAFSAAIATFILGMFKDCFNMAPTVPKWMKLVLPRNEEVQGEPRNQYL